MVLRKRKLWGGPEGTALRDGDRVEGGLEGREMKLEEIEGRRLLR